MRSSSSSRESRKGVRCRRFSFSKHKDCPPAPVKKPEDNFIECEEIDKSFRKCAYPSAAEILKLAEITHMSASVVKAEFSKRRQSYRDRHHLPKEAIVHSLPLFGAFIHSQHALLALCASVVTLWCAQTTRNSFGDHLWTLSQ
ncbi:hypothetical protein TNIN_257391 [Trichonephila inaurata madagascariensis]|uniref:Homeobox domain-containing protein n=1 Tax=Trichonephila inaurata madagascariensis TaxID=2747483 RepID=A0A8X6MKG8_9ARAC|nr:hypothetical protein TNIN_257391 [Trichonephila inaurata madagascariensis]